MKEAFNRRQAKAEEEEKREMEELLEVHRIAEEADEAEAQERARKQNDQIRRDKALVLRIEAAKERKTRMKARRKECQEKNAKYL